MEGPLLQRIKRFTDRHALLRKNGSVLLAVSGGSDSVGLLLLFQDLKRLYRLKVGAAHFNHALRAGPRTATPSS